MPIRISINLWELGQASEEKGKKSRHNQEMERRGTRFMPPLKNFEDAILLLETSENVPSPGIVEVLFRNIGLAGVPDNVNSIDFK